MTDDKPEGDVARRVYHVKTRALQASVFTISHQILVGLCVTSNERIYV